MKDKYGDGIDDMEYVEKKDEELRQRELEKLRKSRKYNCKFSDILDFLENNPKLRAYRNCWIPSWDDDEISVGQKYVYIEPGKTIKEPRSPQKEWLAEIGKKEMEIHPHFVLFNETAFVEWVPSTEDIFASDWVIY